MKYFGKAVAVSASAVLAAVVFAGQASAEAHKKDDNVSLDVYGKGLHVNYADIFAGSPTLKDCLNGRLTFTPPGKSPTVFHGWHDPSTPCGSGAFYTQLAQNTRWPNNTKVCATFYKKNGKRWGGKPCATIHN
ncbi:hypothetical protein ACGFY7_48005 [Streptomyces prunicolor]|uniref:hypothetical protein n=1 Tax=Streptomyces prunicolor TaxID=67348 RepID=UPI0037230EA0